MDAPVPAPTPTDATSERDASPRGDDAPVVKQGRVADVVDGDTFDMADGTTVRIAIADTPEVSGGTEPCGPAASNFTASFLTGETVAIYRPESAPRTDPFDRLLGEVVRVSDGASLNVALVSAGLATVDERFTDEDPDLAERLRAAASMAEDPTCAQEQGGRSASDGAGGVVIGTVREDGPGNDVEQYNDSEYVELRNVTGDDVALGGWTLTDQADHRHTVPSGFTLPAGGTFRVYSGAGDDDATGRLYLDLSQAWLNNDGDTIQLYDPSGARIDTYSY